MHAIEQVQVVGEHAGVEEPRGQRLQGRDVVVDALEQHGLVQQRHAGLAQRTQRRDHHVVDLLRERAREKDVELESTTRCAGVTVDCDRDQLVQVLLNLVVNALQAAPRQAGRGGHVQLSTAVDGAEFRIDVDDDGPGIPAARREEILEPFVSDRAGGIGLGLSIVREIVALHRGRLAIADSPLGGARFTIWLPRERAAAHRKQNP
ncbi:MAG: hypothetical protein C6Y20_21495 [Tagaea sp. CACIAM 22H2]|nr:hypothetical protein [Tagaea sp. CACIAM 22H2]